MQKLFKKDFHEIDKWMHRNARELELGIWRYHFAGGNKEAVLSALAYYQNSDGGFGNKLEPDSWNPNSSPYTTLRAINILKGIDFTDINHPIYRGIIKFLERSEHCSDYGWCFSIPINDNFAHAPWWSYSIEANTYESIGITSELSAFILMYLKENNKLYSRALNYIDHILKQLYVLDNHGDMGILGYCTLLDEIKESKLTKQYNYEELDKKIKELVSNSIEKDTKKWAGYSTCPSKYIKSPQSIYYDDNMDILNEELDYLVDTRPKNSVWGITWSWFKNNEKYAKEFAISENWWKGIIAIDNVVLLKNFGRIDE